MMSRRPKKQPTADDEIRRKCCVYARKELDKLFADSLIDHNKISKYPKYDMHELTLGKILGQGSFGLVREIKAIHIIQGSSHNNNNNTTKQSTRRGGGNRRVSDKSLLNTSRHRPPPLIDEEVEFGDMESKCFIAHHCLRQDGDARYAVKTLRPQLHEDNIPKFLQGILDMGIEAKVLSDVEHPNIIKLRALSTCEPCAQGFFIVMDRLYDTLEQRLRRWHGKIRKYSGLGGKLLVDRQGSKAAALYEERMVASYELSAAFAHLHDRHLVYRDIKPENIGFDIRGDIKVFDFGLVKVLKDDMRNADGTYRLTESTGSPRYMAPEIANGLPYNQSCDVYSFGILLWQMLSCEEPFSLYAPRQLRDSVYNKPHKRPHIESDWPEAVQQLLPQMWAASLHDRLTMKAVQSALKDEVVRCRGGKDVDLDFERRRSTFVFEQQTSSA